MIEAYFTGASFVIKDSATGDAHNSPIVWNKYANTNQYMAEDPLVANSEDAADIKKNPVPMIIVPIAILNKEEASLFFEDLDAQ